jgi:hypothetical protein
MKKAQEDYDQDTQEEQDWTFKNTTSVTKLIEHLTMTEYIIFGIKQRMEGHMLNVIATGMGYWGGNHHQILTQITW